jgi:putative peptidoglycan lipid II flippase
LSSARWTTWRKQSVNRSILAAIFTIGSLGFVVKIVFAAKDVLVAQQFGTSSDLDAFLLAFTVLSFVINLTTGSLESSFIPTYLEIRDTQGRAAAQTLLSTMMGRSLVILSGLGLALAFAAPLVMSVLASGFTAQTLELSHQLFLLMLPLLVLNGLVLLWSAVLNADEHFALVALVPVSMPIATAIFVVFAADLWGVYSLLAGSVAGITIQAAILLGELKRRRAFVLPRWQDDSGALHRVSLQYFPMIAGAFLLNGTDLIDKAMATPLGPGSVSALNYGYKLVALVLNTVILALGTAVLPPFSRMVAAADWNGLRHTLKTYTLLILAATIPVTALLVVFSETLIRILFERGAFTPSDTQLVGRIQAFYFLQLPFHVLGILFVRVISSLKMNQVLMVISGINFVTNIIFNYLFIQWMGITGIALSSSTVYFISFILIALALWKIMREKMSGGVVHGSE